MSVSKISKGLLLGMALLLATSGFAANKGTLQVNDPVTVNGKQLGAGEYTVKWDGAGPNVELNILRGKNVVATVPARTAAVTISSVVPAQISTHAPESAGLPGRFTLQRLANGGSWAGPVDATSPKILTIQPCRCTRSAPGSVMPGSLPRGA